MVVEATKGKAKQINEIEGNLMILILKYFFKLEKLHKTVKSSKC